MYVSVKEKEGFTKMANFLLNAMQWVTFTRLSASCERYEDTQEFVEHSSRTKDYALDLLRGRF